MDSVIRQINECLYCLLEKDELKESPRQFWCKASLRGFIFQYVDNLFGGEYRAKRPTLVVAQAILLLRYNEPVRYLACKSRERGRKGGREGRRRLKEDAAIMIESVVSVLEGLRRYVHER